MTPRDAVATTQMFLARFLKRFKRAVRDSLKWVHLLAVTGILYVCPMQLLEAIIVVILMFEIGFEFAALDRLIELNNRLRAWALSKFVVKRRKKPC